MTSSFHSPLRSTAKDSPKGATPNEISPNKGNQRLKDYMEGDLASYFCVYVLDGTEKTRERKLRWYMAKHQRGRGREDRKCALLEAEVQLESAPSSAGASENSYLEAEVGWLKSRSRKSAGTDDS